jgi:hypothetical protein
VTDGDCCACGDASVCHGGFCVTAGEAAPMCKVGGDCSASHSCIDALCK